MPSYTVKYAAGRDDPLMVVHGTVQSREENILQGRALAAWIYHNMPGGTVDELLRCCRDMSTLRQTAMDYRQPPAPQYQEPMDEEEEALF